MKPKYRATSREGESKTAAAKMGVKPFSVFFIVIFLFFLMANSEKEEVRQGLVTFLDKLAPGNGQRDSMLGWNLISDPCTDKWHGVSCHSDNKSVKSIVLEKFSLSGVVDASSLCIVKSLQVLRLRNNGLHDLIPEDIRKCKSLTHLFLSGNKFSGDLPISIAELSNLKRLHVSDNYFTGQLPNMVCVSSLISFLAENNNFTGKIPDFDFSNLDAFNVSNNNLQGPVPDVGGKFNADSFSGNLNLCGKPLSNACPPSSSPSPSPSSSSSQPLEKKDRKSFGHGFPIYSGYIILGLVVLLFLSFKWVSKFKNKEEALEDEKKEMAQETSGDKPSETSNSNGSKNGIGIRSIRSEYSLTSLESGMTTSGLVVLTSRTLRGFQFEDLLSAPAELIRRGKHGSLYKVMLDNGVVLAVKRIKDWGISKQDFKRRMDLIAQVKHPRVMPPVAYYCSQQEKLLAYEYLQNGSLFMLLYGSPSGNSFDWRSRLNVAAVVAEALAYMHEELLESGIAHGNLKSSNILFDKNMDPWISEYGLMVAENQDQSVISHNKSLKNKSLTAATFKADVYAFGVMLLELLTGKVVKNDGFDLVKWAKSVVREEWTVEVFDKFLISQGASEERMMNLLQVALKCVSSSPNDRPSMSQVAVMTNALKEEEEKSISFDT
ncbi:probable inactive receptor kinase At2g26730 [Gastrolobium bilobum]|uniref:probable inactive receptor kinase At2g26730 n=1 Tax=Gastrolobium bilobum TaxID=150636 RepID=UPI002AB24BE2|nr:probable inactive receptor kinase At2g26730 [Gastrolobium bilobum]